MKNDTKEKLKKRISLFKNNYEKEVPKQMDLNKRKGGEKEAIAGKGLKNQLIYINLMLSYKRFHG